MSQSPDVTSDGLAAAPTVDQALAALTEPRSPGTSPRRLGWRRERHAMATAVPSFRKGPSPDAPGLVAPAAGAGTEGEGEAEAAPVAPTRSAASEPLEDAVAIEALGPYIARLMVDARSAAADYSRETEREAAERAAEICAAAVVDADAIRARAVQEADAILDAARIQAQSLSSRVAAMAAELRAGADVLAQPSSVRVAEAAPAPEPAAVVASEPVIADAEIEAEAEAEVEVVEVEAVESELVAAGDDAEDAKTS